MSLSPVIPRFLFGVLCVYLTAFSLSLTGFAAGEIEISDCDDLQAMADDRSADYILVNDIDCSVATSEGGSLYNDGAGFNPIGDNTATFTGSLDGQGYTISGLTINRPAEDYATLIGYLTVAGSVTNVVMTDASITGRIYTTGLVGVNFGTISKVSFSGTVSGNQIVGGLVGENAGTLTLSSTSGTVSATNVWYTGGLVANNTGTIRNSYSTADVTGVSRVGGLVGDNADFGEIVNSYASGEVVGTSDFGGLVGRNYYEILEPEFLESEGTITDSFYDSTIAGVDDAGKGTGELTAAMKDIATFTDTDTVGLATAWDFVGTPNDDAGNNDYWGINSALNGGYPYLVWQDVAPAPPSALAVTADGADVSLSWSNPADADFASITIRRDTTGFPSISGGGLVVANLVAESYSNTDLEDATYYYSVFAKDDGGNYSTAATASVTVDTTAPVIDSVSSDTANGSYGVGDVIDIDLTFSEAVTSTGAVTVTLETGDTDRTCSFTVTNSTTASCNYTVQTYDESDDLEVKTVSGTIADQYGNAMSNFTPLANLAENKALVVDGNFPTVTFEPNFVVIIPGTGARYTNHNSILFTVTFSEGVSGLGADDFVIANADFDGVLAISDTLYLATVNPTGGTVSFAINADSAVDGAGNGNIAETPYTIIYDRSAPSGSLSSSVSSGGNTSLATVPFTVTFNEDVQNFAASDISVSNGVVSNFATSTADSVFTFNVTPTAQGPVTLQIAAGALNDLAGNDSLAVSEFAFTYRTGGSNSALLNNFNKKLEAERQAQKEALLSGDDEDLVENFAFNDIKGHWAEIYIDFLHDCGLINGFADNSFKPDESITRAELVKIAVKMGVILEMYKGSMVSISDEEDPWYSPYIGFVTLNKIASGYADGFHPDQAITREEALKILSVVALLPYDQSWSNNAVFSDVNPDEWYEKYVQTAFNLGLAQGYDDGSFGTGKSITRSEVAKLVSKILVYKGF